jgi:SAM-dependent methyltransferase
MPEARRGPGGPNLFLNTAELYDLDVASIAEHDLPFYRRALQGVKGRVLELACGTGRVAIPLAEAGFEVVGLDYSMPMLDVFRRKIRKLPRKTARRIQLFHGSMARFSLNETFGAVICPFRGFQALTDPEEIRSSLASIRRHLGPQGLGIIDLFWMPDPPGNNWYGEHVDWVRKMPGSDTTVTRSRVGRVVDEEAQILYSEIMFSVSDPAGGQKRLTDDLALRYYQPYQFQTLLCSSGFRIKKEYGSYRRGPLESGPEQIYLFERL